MIILMISINLPSWNLVGSGIADIIIEILIGIETNSVRIFSEIITFGTSIEDLYLEKIILLIIINLAEVNACLIEKEKLMQIILQIINPNIKKKKIKWNPSQFWDIWIYAINALSILVPKMSKQFVDYNGGIRLCMILEWCLDIKFDIKITRSTVICIYNSNIEKFKYYYIKNFISLLLAIGSYIWECIVWCPENLEKFIDYGGIYIILDIIEIVPYCSHCLFLALFTDICDNFFCGPFICTWRGINKEKGLMSLLAKIWREEEIRIKIKKNVNDEELIHINQKQFDAYFTKLIKDSSPAIIDMIGSVRSKIYSIYKIIERDNERYLMAKEHYKILNNNLSLEDKITMSTINMYFALKLGQVWVEIAKFFEQSGITPLGMDGQAIFLITQRYYMWTEMTKERQMRILQSIDKQKDMEEKDEYARIRNSKLIIALNALDELDYIYRTTKRSNMLKKKHEQIKQVNLALKFPEDSDDAHCHRTFQDKIMVTDIFNQHQIISSGLKLNTNLSQMKLKLIPISPYDSYISDKTYSEFSSSSSTYFSNIKKFKEDE
ncbi:cilia- and flagella-associated protein 69-like [Apis laboriosa]|uniref:cilia- and flagella-associated protein 69-like n=1 Tax=Apis laboriosa TaxID=183418 RepID=UPI001CC4FABE|nr:cilia- and flagella-associated protein 69-like [Apis laboriosa]